MNQLKEIPLFSESL